MAASDEVSCMFSRTDPSPHVDIHKSITNSVHGAVKICVPDRCLPSTKLLSIYLTYYELNLTRSRRGSRSVVNQWTNLQEKEMPTAEIQHSATIYAIAEALSQAYFNYICCLIMHVHSYH